MPSVSLPQHRWIEWQAHDPEARAKSGLSEAKALEWAHADKGSPWKHAHGGGLLAHRPDALTHAHAGGGGIARAPGGPITPSTQTMNPITMAAIQRYASLPPEKLAELATALGNSPQGQIVQRLLAQKRMMPTQPSPTQTSAPALTAPQPNALTAQPPTALTGQKRGGPVKREMGGPMTGIPLSSAVPWWSRQEESMADRPATGFLSGLTGGRADAVRTSAPGGSYVLPADVVSGLGEGNSIAGARVIDEMLHTQPWGIQGTPVRGNRGLPHPQARIPEAKGGGVQGADSAPRPVPVDLSHGEYVIHPRDVMRIGKGSMKRGHRVLDAWVLHERKKHVAKLKSLPGPVRPK